MSNIANGNGLGWKVAGIFFASFLSIITSLSLFITSGLKAEISGVKTDLVQSETRLRGEIQCVNGNISLVDSKIFTHLTNHDLHIPRDQIITKSEFDLYSRNQEIMINKMYDLVENMRNNEIKMLVEKAKKDNANIGAETK